MLENRIKFIREREADIVKQYKQLQCSGNSKEDLHGQALFELQKENLTLKEQIYEVLVYSPWNDYSVLMNLV